MFFYLKIAEQPSVPNGFVEYELRKSKQTNIAQHQEINRQSVQNEMKREHLANWPNQFREAC